MRFVGKVGSGFSSPVLADLHARMAALRSDACPFVPPPRVRDARWVRPRPDAQIAFAEWTADDRLRQPVLLGLRDDKPAYECTWSARER